MVLRSRLNGSAIPKMADTTSSADCTPQALECESNDESAKAVRLLQCAITFLTGPPVPGVLRAFDQLGISPGLIADVLGIDRGVVTAWRRGQSEIPEEYRVMLLTYLSVLLPWLHGAESHVTPHALSLSFWRQRAQAARQLLDAEMRAAPRLARQARALANCMDLLDRPAAARAVAAHGQHQKQIPTRKGAPRRAVSRNGADARPDVDRLISADETPAAHQPHPTDS